MRNVIEYLFKISKKLHFTKKIRDICYYLLWNNIFDSFITMSLLLISVWTNNIFIYVFINVKVFQIGE